jgi:hypothetical protein
MVGLGDHLFAAMWLWLDFDDPKNPRLAVEFDYWNPLTNDETIVVTFKDRFVACLSISEGEIPATTIALQFATPFCLGPMATNTVAMPVLHPRSVIQPVIGRERHH